MKTEMQKRLFGLALFLFAVIIAAEGAMAGEPSRVAILPFKINADRDVSFLQKGIVDMFTSRLSWEDRVVVIDRDETDHALRSVSMPVNEEIARATGSGLQADYVLFGSLTIFGQSASLDARMVDVHQKRPTLTFFKQMKTIDEVIPQVDLLAMEINETVFAHPGSLLPGKSTGQAKVPSPKPPTAEAPGHTISGGMELAGFWKSQNFKIFIKGLSLGDVDGDSKTETVFISDRHIYVHRFENKRFIRIKEIAGKGSQRFIGVDVADINGNGRAEIFVTSLKGAGQRLDSFVLEWNGDDFRRINKGNHWYYRVIHVPERGKVLLGQRRKLDEPFTPGVYRLAWSNGEYEPGEPLTLPKGINIFGLALGDVMNKGQQMIASFDGSDHIRIFSPSGEEQWKSVEPYGGSINSLEIRSQHGGDMDRLYLPQRIYVQDVDGDGDHELVVVSNQGSLGRLFSHYRKFTSGQIVSLSWKNIGLALNWQTPKVSGCISDYAIGDFDNDGRDDILAAVVASRGTALTDARSSIIEFDFVRPGPTL